MMGILDRLLDLRYPIGAAAALAVALFSLLTVGPSFPAVVGFFGPLLVSTGCFLAAVLVLFGVSMQNQDDESACRAGEELIDYVAGQPVQAEELEGEPEGVAEEKKGEKEAKEEEDD